MTKRTAKVPSRSHQATRVEQEEPSAKASQMRKLRQRMFALAVADGLASVGWIYFRSITPTKYDKPYNCDLHAIGSDMWRGVEAVKREQAYRAA